MPYRVQPGDTLSAIAAAHGISLSDMVAANPSLQGNPDLIRVGQLLALPGDAPAPPPAPAPAWILGQLSEKYETGGRGPGTVSSGIGDYGGVSYGSYQMSSQPGGGTVTSYVTAADFPWRDQFAGLAPGSDAFSAAWRSLAQDSSDPFQQSQHLFIRQTHFDPLTARLRSDLTLDVLAHPAAVQDVTWSTAVQHGPNSPVIQRAAAQMQTTGVFDPAAVSFNRALIVAIYAERGRTDINGVLVYFKSSSPAVQQGVKLRFANEQRDALAMLGT